MQLTGIGTLDQLQSAHRDWINVALLHNTSLRKAYWSESVAVGSQHYIHAIQSELGCRAQGRQCVNEEGRYVLKEPDVSYSIDLETEKVGLS